MKASQINHRTIKIDCAYDELIDTERLIPNPRNPNQHPQKQLDLLAKIIEHQGFRNPIVVSNRSGFVIKGHARLEAAKMLDLKQCPVDYQDYENEAAEWADMIADNRIAELADPSLPDLKDLLQELDTGAFDMDLTGFDAGALEELMTQVWMPETDLPEGIGELAKRVIIVFDNTEQELEFWHRMGRDAPPVGKVIFHWGDLRD
jgi:ParB-like chromosome segregation protein Spo0J